MTLTTSGVATDGGAWPTIQQSVDRGAIDDALARKATQANKTLMIGAVICGSMALGPFGAVILIAGFILTRRVEKLGFLIRPWPVTIMGVFCLVDAGVNMMGWALVSIAHDASVSQTFFFWYGSAIDAAYYYGFNTHAISGQVATVSETVLQWATVFLLMPMRIAGAIGFLNMKRWGLQVMIITGWMYAFLWIAYALQFTLQPERYATTYGLVGWWLINIWYITPFIMLPFLYVVKRDLWADDRELVPSKSAY
jgi:hypothetical protein